MATVETTQRPQKVVAPPRKYEVKYTYVLDQSTLKQVRVKASYVFS